MGNPELRRAIRAAGGYRPDPARDPVVLALPFDGRWLAVRTPAQKVPSHGTHFGGTTYALDFVGVDTRARTATVRDWRSLLWTEPLERFVAYGRRVFAPLDGEVVTAHDGEPDGVARRSPVGNIPYALGQRRPLFSGFPAMLGNHVILHSGPEEYVLLAHLRQGSVAVHAGDRVSTGDCLGECGNSGNSTEPHLHIQAMDSADLLRARGLPVDFYHYRIPGGPVRNGVPDHLEEVEPASPWTSR